jgi:ligand-binding sensor domain-containing protein
VSAIGVAKDDPDKIFVSVVNDREWGGVFSLHYGRQQWQQKSTGLGGRDVFCLKQSIDGALLAGTNRGLFILDKNGGIWRPSNIVILDGKALSPRRPGTRMHAPSGIDIKVNEIDVIGARWLVATSRGVFVTSDRGKTWSGGPVLGRSDFVSVQALGDLEVAATGTEVLLSKNAGAEWYLCAVPPDLIGIRSVTLTADGQVLVASREGGFRSIDAGATWEHMSNGLPATDISSITYDQERGRLLATSMSTSFVFQSKDGGRIWQEGPDSGYPLRRISVMGTRFVAATPSDGVIIEP